MDVAPAAPEEAAAGDTADAGTDRPAPIQSPRSVGRFGALERTDGEYLGQRVKSVFYCWLLVFALVGMQMSWVLRPFIGNPAKDFTWFRERESSFVGGILNTVQDLLVPKR